MCVCVCVCVFDLVSVFAFVSSCALTDVRTSQDKPPRPSSRATHNAFRPTSPPLSVYPPPSQRKMAPDVVLGHPAWNEKSKSVSQQGSASSPAAKSSESSSDLKSFLPDGKHNRKGRYRCLSTLTCTHLLLMRL